MDNYISDIRAAADEIIDMMKTVKTIAYMRGKRHSVSVFDMAAAMARIDNIRETIDPIEIFARAEMDE